VPSGNIRFPHEDTDSSSSPNSGSSFSDEGSRKSKKRKHKKDKEKREKKDKDKKKKDKKKKKEKDRKKDKKEKEKKSEPVQLSKWREQVGDHSSADSDSDSGGETRRSAISGKKIKMKTRKSREEKQMEVNRKNLLNFLNQSF